MSIARLRQNLDVDLMGVKAAKIMKIALIFQLYHLAIPLKVCAKNVFITQIVLIIVLQGVTTMHALFVRMTKIVHISPYMHIVWIVSARLNEYSLVKYLA